MEKHHWRARSCRSRSRCPAKGFTLVELLVVLATIGILASLLFPVVREAVARSQGTQCLNNTRQLTLAWLLYADDEQGRLCPNGSGLSDAWVGGVLDFNGSTDNTNILFLIDPRYARLAPYVTVSSLYHCPSDRSRVHMLGGVQARVRSLAMNEAVGSDAQALSLPPGRGWKLYQKQSEITAPSPANLWVLTEQHPDSIDDGRFAVDCADQNQAARWIDFPAFFHDRSANFSFADGHSELHRWVRGETTPPMLYCGCLAHYAARGVSVSGPNSPDIAWLQARTSAPGGP
jgi:prepilin-type N-terminal cleavage/methylation domain-containing protein/prepilin-type processing-associated H-X9-DG protein